MASDGLLLLPQVDGSFMTTWFALHDPLIATDDPPIACDAPTAKRTAPVRHLLPRTRA
jgi:hypothetical protein